MRRRRFLEVLVGAVALGLTACTGDPVLLAGRGRPVPGAQPSLGPASVETPSAPVTPALVSGSTAAASPAVQRLFHAPVGIVRVPVPYGTITGLPGAGNLVALTVDDGTDGEVVAAYALLAARTGLRLTFFANGYLPSWTEHALLLRPLVEQGQALIANHTWSHPNLTRLSDWAIAEEVQRNERFLEHTYGANGRPFLRPPYGVCDGRVQRVLTELGYPAITMWYGSLGDSTVIAPAEILANARRWLLPQHLVIGHANHRPVLDVMDEIVDIIRDRALQPVHLADIYRLA